MVVTFKHIKHTKHMHLFNLLLVSDNFLTSYLSVTIQ